MSISIYIFDLQVTRVKSEKRNAKTFIMVRRSDISPLEMAQVKDFPSLLYVGFSIF
jgi:hypothetical protein